MRCAEGDNYKTGKQMKRNGLKAQWLNDGGKRLSGWGDIQRVGKDRLYPNLFCPGRL